MIQSSVEKMARDIGFDIGHSSDTTQADLFNGFAEAFYSSMTKIKRETQIAYMVDKFKYQAENVFLEIAEFIKLKQEGR